MALLVVVGVLGILSVLGVAFVSLARLERRAALQRLHATKAQLLARSGLEDLQARLASGEDPLLATTRYRGEDWNGSGVLNGIEVPAEVYRITGAGTAPDVDACPVRHAMRPAFYVRLKPTQNPRLNLVDGRQRGYSGWLGALSEQYALKVRSGGIFLNGGDPASAAAVGYNAVLRRILRTLAEALDREDGVDDGIPVNLTDGGLLVGARPVTGWTSWEQVKALALGGSQTKLEALKPYLTLESWVDARVIRPNPVAANTSYACWADLRAGRGTVPGNATPGPATRTAPDFERIPVSGGAVVGRAPVELAWARTRRPVLLALLAGLKGLYLDASEAKCIDTVPNDAPINWGDLIGTMKEVELALDPAAYTGEAADVADALLSYTTDIASWRDWDAFCDTLAFSGTPAEVQAKRDLLKAHFNPNGALTKFNPNRSRWRTVDKQEIPVYSTEFSLDPVQGLEFESCGRVLGPGGRVLAVRAVRAVRTGPSVVRISTQREFCAESLGDPFVFGDEGDLRLPGFRRAGSPDFLTRNRGLEFAWGHRINATAQYPGTWLDASAAAPGTGLQSYPEPCVRTGGVLRMSPADWDGSLQLATLETVLDDMYGIPPAPGFPPPPATARNMTCLARFDDAFALDEADGAKPYQPDVQQVTAAELTNSLLLPVGASLAAPPKLNTLMPDGCYSERDRAPCYTSVSNLDGFRGVISMWVKRNYAVPTQAVNRAGHVFLNAIHYGVPLQPQFVTNQTTDRQFYLLDTLYYAGQPECGLFYETGNAGSDTDAESRNYVFHANLADPAARRWSLLTVFWDGHGRRENDALNQTHLDGGGGALSKVLKEYGLTAPGVATSLTLADAYGAHRFCLGFSGGPGGPRLLEEGANPYYGLTNLRHYGGHADATLDEVAAYDLGGSYDWFGIWTKNADALAAPALLASGRWKEGRYAKGWKYNATALSGSPSALAYEAPAWFSAPVNLPAGSLVRRVSWTWTRPAALPDDFPDVELADAAGAFHLWSPAESRARAAAGWSPDKAFWEPGRPVPGPFRIRVGFSRVTPLGGADPSDETMVQDTPILDSPALDDLTILVEPPGGPRLSSWAGSD